MAVRAVGLSVAAVVAASLIAVNPVRTADAAGGCSAYASAVWKPAGGRGYRTEAFSGGPTCALAVATLVVRAPDGKVMWAAAAPTDSLMTFVEVKTRAQMTRALGEWLMQSHMFKSSAELPEWKKGADAPMSGEFPFYPEADVDRQAYEQIRSERQPVFCYVQSMESLSCLGLSKDGTLTKIGVQLFPG